MRYLALKANAFGHLRTEMAALALGRLAASDNDQAARLLEDRWTPVLGAEHAAWAWSQVAKQAALGLKPEALGYTRTAWDTLPKKGSDQPDWSDETLGWLARAALRQGEGPERWKLARRAIEAMSPPSTPTPAGSTGAPAACRRWPRLARPVTPRATRPGRSLRGWPTSCISMACWRRRTWAAHSPCQRAARRPATRNAWLREATPACNGRWPCSAPACAPRP